MGFRWFTEITGNGSSARGIPPEDLNRFQKEAESLFRRRLSAALWIGVILIPLFTLLDLVLAREHFYLFFLTRIACSLGLLALLLLHQGKPTWLSPLVTSLLGCTLAGMAISLMVVKMGGYASFYYVGLLLVLITCTTLLPLTPFQAGLTGILLYLIYSVPILLFSTATPQNLALFFNNSFFFLSFIIIATVNCWAENKGRIQQFKLRMEIDRSAKKLAYYAEHLEQEVERRARALEDSELRYRELYENIIDMVALIDDQGSILMANPRFCEAFLDRASSVNGLEVRRFILADDIPVFDSAVIEALAQRSVIKDVEFRMLNNSGGQLIVECSAKTIRKNDETIGHQLVIRDITVRKQLQQELLASCQALDEARSATILGLAKLSEYRDKETGYHLERIREYTRILAEGCAKLPQYRPHITPEYIEDLHISSILHDIGKVAIPDAILLKPDRLTPDEFEVIKQHSALGGDALREVEAQLSGHSFLTLATEIAYHHHERWDGSGYPDGLRAEDIPLSTRLVALADVYDALTSDRVYKKAYSHEAAKAIIVAEKGRHFCPEVVEVFLEQEEDFNRTRQAFDNLK